MPRRADSDPTVPGLGAKRGRRTLRQRLAEMELFRSMVDLSGDLLLMVDADTGEILDANASACRRLGRTREELVGLRFADFLEAPARARLLGILAHCEPNAGTEATLVSSLPWAGGLPFQAEISVGCACGVAGDARVAVVAARDITHRLADEMAVRQAEECHRIALEAAELGTWRHDIVAGTIWHDERARRYCGVRRETVPAEEVFGRIHPEDAGRFAAAMAVALDPLRSRGHTASEFRMLGPDGKVRWLRVHAHIRFEGEGEARHPVETIGTMEDVTERKRVEEQVARLTKAYESLSEINKYVARAGSEPYLLAMACQVAVEHVGFSLVRVVALQNDDPSVRGGATWHGRAEGLLDHPDPCDWHCAMDERHPLGAALRVRGHYCSGRLAADPFLAPGAAVCEAFRVRAMGIFPLSVEGRLAFLMIFYAPEVECFDPAMVRLLKEMATDIGFGLDRLAESRRVRDTELRFSAVFRFSPVCILISRMSDGRVVDVNDAFLDTFDYTLDEIVGRRALERSFWADPRDRAALLHALEAGGPIKDFEAVWCRRSGRKLDCLLSGEIVLLGGERHLVCLVTDVTERRQAERLLHAREQEFRALAENAPDNIVRYDKECRRLYANPAMCRSAGLSLPEMIGRSPVETMPDRKVAVAVHDAVARVFAGAGETELEVTAREAPNRPPVHRHIRFVPEFDSDGEVVSVLGIGRDITRLKDTEQRLRDIQGQLRELGARREAAREDERKRMAREIHDVLGQLLTALRLDVDMLGMEFGAEQPLLLERTAKTMAMIDGTIAIVRNLATALRPSALDMGIVSALDWLAKDFSGRTGVACEVSVAEGEVNLDETQAIGVFRLVQESLTNVVRHARASRVEVSLDKVAGGYRLSVADDGVGFDPARTPSRSLGLVGMRERAMGLGGKLEVRSAPGKGTVIELRFPTRPAGSAAANIDLAPLL